MAKPTQQERIAELKAKHRAALKAALRKRDATWRARLDAAAQRHRDAKERKRQRFCDLKAANAHYDATW